MAIPDDLPPEAVADCFGPPPEPCECYCLHCQRVVNSSDMWYQRVIDGPPGLGGFWMCPTPNCDGQGFSFDLHPTDPDHPANAGWSWSDDEEWDESDDVDGGDESADYDPAEPQYADDGPDEEVVEGDEWKHGLPAGDPAAESPDAADARRRREDEQRRYDEPDRRPRTVDGSGWRRDDERPSGVIGDDDIPF